jgi:hypothetical protein
MDPILNILSQVGLGVASNAVYDYLKKKFTTAGASIDRHTLEAELQNVITLNGVTMRASTVIDALARNGFLVIEGSHLHGPQALTFGSVQGSAVAGNNTRLSTDKTSIDAGAGAFVKTEGNSQIRQNPDGSISFHVGDGSSSISFHVPKKG